MENKLNLILTDEEKTAVQANVQNLTASILEKLVSLTTSERVEMLKMGDKSMAFVEKAYEYANQYPQMAPNYLDMDGFKADWDAYKYLRNLKQSLLPLMEALDDSTMAAGSEAYQASLLYYQGVKMAAQNNIAGAREMHDDLQKRWPGRPKSSSETAVE